MYAGFGVGVQLGVDAVITGRGAGINFAVGGVGISAGQGVGVQFAYSYNDSIYIESDTGMMIDASTGLEDS